MSVTSGPTSRTALAFFDPDSSSWKMSAVTFPWDSTPSSPTLPASGMTRRGALFELPTLEPATAEPACSSLPTPTTQPSTGNGHARNLGKEAALLRTPQAQVTEPKPGIKLAGRSPSDPQVGLIDQVLALLPTPVANDTARSPEAHMAMKAKMPGGARDQITSLSVMARQAASTGEWDAKLLPTPEASDGSGGRRSKELGGIRPSGAKRAVTLATAVDHQLLPTPTRRDYKGHNQRHDETCLTGAVVPLLPTPQARDGDHTRGADPERYRGSKSMGGRRVNLDDMIAATKAGRWRGEHTEPPSPAMSASPDDPPPTLWTEKAG